MCSSKDRLYTVRVDGDQQVYVCDKEIERAVEKKSADENGLLVINNMIEKIPDKAKRNLLLWNFELGYMVDGNRHGV